MDKQLFYSGTAATDDFRVQPFCGFHETIKHCFKREPHLGCHSRKPEIDTESVPGQLVPVGDVVRYEGLMRKEPFLKSDLSI